MLAKKIKKVAIVKIIKYWIFILLISKYNWAISNININIIRNLKQANIKKYQRFKS